MSNGNLLRSFPLPQNWDIAGVDATGTMLLVYQWYDLQGSCFDLSTGRSVWNLDYSDLVKDKSSIANMPNAFFRADGSAIILQLGDKIICRDKAGHEEWQRVAKSGSHWTAIGAANVVDKILAVAEPESSAVIGLSTAKGSEGVEKYQVSNTANIRSFIMKTQNSSRFAMGRVRRFALVEQVVRRFKYIQIQVHTPSFSFRETDRS